MSSSMLDVRATTARAIGLFLSLSSVLDRDTRCNWYSANAAFGIREPAG
ncbi:hypothetical protein [Burkholderia lata]|nr:hypothetical protein [Burkholderia lata]